MSGDGEEREIREREALLRHEMLSRLFREDRLAFERERKRMIETFIDGVDDESLRARLWAFQEKWDRTMKGAGSAHNRFVLAQMFFWEHLRDAWLPAIERLNSTRSRGPEPCKT